MKLGLGIGPVGAPGGERIIELAKEAENLGYDTIWCPEIYGMTVSRRWPGLVHTPHE